ncbi:MAG: hypothetical protein IPP69_18115 [Flavobacteriales bacterium]|nr:hypothetical protein [Flavobacteriales bacterium]
MFFDEIHSEDSLRSPNQYQVQFLNDEGEPVNPANTKLVMLMSTESSTVSRRISSLAQSEETLQTMARLANQDKIGENVLLNSQCNQIDSMAVGLASAGEKFIVEKISVDNGGLDSTSANQLRILSFLNYAAALKGSKEPYQTIDDALEMLKK